MRMVVFCSSLIWLLSSLACRTDSETQRLKARQLRDVPAARLAFTFQADAPPPPGVSNEEPVKLEPIQRDFDTNGKNNALRRTVVSPDGQRALAIYETGDGPDGTYRIDLYAADGKFLRNLTPPELAVVFDDSVVWSPDNNFIAFVGRKVPQPKPSPTPVGDLPDLPGEAPVPTPSILPAFAPLAVFNTEQVYLCNKDGYDLKPLTTRDGLIYFALTWAPDSHALAALACRESEWTTREREFKTPAGRPRVISLDGQERLLDDELAEAPPVWSPDSSKIATAFGLDIGVYDGASKAPTQARITLRERLLTASAAFDEKSQPVKKPTEPANKATPQPASPLNTVPFSFNPIVRLEWPVPEQLFVETAYISLRSELIKTFSRWHLLTLSPQAVALR